MTTAEFAKEKPRLGFTEGAADAPLPMPLFHV